MVSFNYYFMYILLAFSDLQNSSYYYVFNTVRVVRLGSLEGKGWYIFLEFTFIEQKVTLPI